MAHIAARMAIGDVLHRYARAMDRMDKPLALSCWHAGGTDEHTPLFAGSAQGFVDWVWRLHEPMADSATTIVPNNPEAPIYPATRDRADPSYAFLGGHQTRLP